MKDPEEKKETHEAEENLISTSKRTSPGKKNKTLPISSSFYFLEASEYIHFQNVWRARNSYGRVKDMDSLQPMKDPEEKKETEIQCSIFKFQRPKKKFASKEEIRLQK